MIKVKIYILLIVLASTCLPLYSQVEINASELVDSVMLNDSLANYYSEKGDLRKAQQYALNNVSINSLLGEKSVEYAVAILKYARYLSPNDRDKAVELSKNGLSILKDSLGIKSSIYIKYLIEYAWRQFNNNKIHEACNILQEVAEAKDTNDELYLGYLYYSYAHFLRESMIIDKSKTYALKAKTIFERNRMTDDVHYLNTITDLAFLNIDNKESAINYLNVVKKNTKRIKGENSIEYMNVLLNFAYVYRYSNELYEALNYAIQAKDIGKLIKDLDYSSFLYTLYFLSGRYSSLKQYDEAIKYAEECLSLMKETKAVALSDRLPVLDSLIIYYNSIRDVEKTNSSAKEAYLIRKSLNISGKEMEKDLYYLLHSNHLLGKYEDCEVIISEIKELYADSFSTCYKHYYEDMELLMNSFFKQKRYEDALAISNELEETYMKQYGEENDYLASIYSTRANIYTYLGDMDNYQHYSLRSLNIIENFFGENSYKYLFQLSTLANSYYNLGYYDKAHGMFKKATQIASNIYGKMHMLFVTNYLSTMIMPNSQKELFFNDYKLEELYCCLFFQRLICEVNNNNSNETEKTLNSQYYFVNASSHNLISKYYKDPFSLKALYNCLLLYKLDVLDLEVFKDKVNDELDQEANTLFSEYCKTNSAYIKAQISPEAELLDSLYKRSNQIRNVLSKKSSIFRNYISRFVTVDSLINHLQNNEVIIDYLPLSHFYHSFNDYYVIINKKRKFPEFISARNTLEKIVHSCSSYTTLYFLTDNDSILSHFNIDRNKQRYVFGYKSSINHIMKRDQNDLSMFPQNATSNHGDFFISAIMEFDRGVELYNKKQYSLAIKAFCQCDSLMLLAKGDKSNYYGHGTHWIASCYHNIGNDSVAERFSQYYYLEPINIRQTLLSDSLLDVASSLYDQGRKKEAIEKYIEASLIEKTSIGNNSYWYANTLSHCAEICLEINDINRAIELEKEALCIREKSPGIDHIDYYWSLKNLFNSYLHIGLEYKTEMYKYGELLSDFMEKYKDRLGLEESYYPILMYSLAHSYTEDKKTTKALEYCNKTIESTDYWIDYPKVYAELYHGIILNLKILREDSLAFNLCKHIIPMYEKNNILQKESKESFVDILNIIANYYYFLGDFISASLYQEKAIGILDKNRPIYNITLSNLALTYCELGKIEEAIELAEKAVMLDDKGSNIVYDLGARVKGLLNLAHCYSVANRQKEALRIGIRSFNMLKDEYGLDNYQTLVAANNLASYYNELGYIEEVYMLLSLVVEHAEKDIQRNGDILGTAYNNLAMNWARERLDFQKSLEYINRSYEIRKEVLGENNLFTIQSLFNKGRCLLDLGKVEEGFSCVAKALSSTKDLIGENNIRYAEMMKIMTVIYGNSGDLKRALKVEEERNELLKEIVGEQHISYIKSLEALSELYFYTNDTTRLYNTIIEESNRYRRMVISDLSNYTSVERANLVYRMGTFYDWLFPFVCYYKNSPQIRSELYNALLLRKGLLLNTDIEFSRIIRESGDSVLVNRFNSLLANKNILNKQYQLPNNQRIFNVDSLRNIINEDEDFLVAASNEFRERIKNYNTSWEDIKKNLKADEISVEFVMFNDTSTARDKIYYALLVDNKSENPEFVPLFRETELEKVLKEDKEDGGLYQLIWEPIVRNRQNTKAIFFSPCGLLNNIGIEYLYISGKEYITDKYNLYRLSSTREIMEKRIHTYKSAALYGGLNYTVDTDFLLAQNKMYGEGWSSSRMYRGLSDSLSVRNSFDPLFNTKMEISEISETLKSNNVLISLYSENYGTEESFKGLAGKGINLIHLATHGMYVGSSDAKSKRRDANLTFIQIDDSENGNIQEDKSLSRSFLVMSGGDMLPSHKEIPENIEDGILTAYEISKLDLKGLDMVVLSACQTALGDVDNEGVYGLQRGFKKAGANTILMSLDKVNDEATKILMVEFYKNLMSGKTKHQSLKDAQIHLRQVDNGKYDKPEYWASFIMLDGLN